MIAEDEGTFEAKLQDKELGKRESRWALAIPDTYLVEVLSEELPSWAAVEGRIDSYDKVSADAYRTVDVEGMSSQKTPWVFEGRRRRKVAEDPDTAYLEIPEDTLVP